jgi:hypothetical protein
VIESDEPTVILDWNQLRREIVGRQRDASTKGSTHWGRLVELVDDRLGAAPSDKAPPLVNTRWWLVEVRISGFRGVANDFGLSVEPHAGLTVVHGPNGSGKSSVAEAVRAAIWGAPAPQPRQLWEPVNRAAGAARACVEIVLRSGSGVLRCRWSDDPRPHTTATWIFDGLERDVSVADPNWQAALAAFTPVFSYAETQDRLGTPKALVQHLDDLLALGPCFALLSEDVSNRAADAKAAVDRLQKIKKVTRSTLDKVDEQFASPTTPPLPAVMLPNRFSAPDPNGWLADNGLDGDLATTGHAVTDEAITEIRRHANALRLALERLDATDQRLDDRLDERIHGHLMELHSDLAAQPPGGPCPVCGQNVDWWSSLSNIARHLAEWGQARTSVNTAAGQLSRLHHEQVRPLVIAATELNVDADGMVAALLEPPPHQGRTTTERSRLRDVANPLLASGFTTLAHGVRERGDRQRCWRAARREAVDPLVAAWRMHGPAAATANDWTQASKNLTVLRQELRDARGMRLGQEVGEVLHRLLSDTPLTLAGLDLGGDALRLVGADGDPRRLGTLSAGQRNALFLAPLLRARSDGPFGFLLVDDPVHAFDDLRIDLVSDELVRLARDRRVLVLTHDSRLTEALTAKIRDADVRSLLRDANGSVIADARSAPWISLLTDAESLLSMPDLPAELGKLPVVVRGLCRHAVDGAVRELALRWAVLAKQDPKATLDALNKRETTKVRLKHAERYHLPGRPSPAADALQACNDNLTAWNQAAHNTGGDSPAGLHAEIGAARAACTLLAAWGAG